MRRWGQVEGAEPGSGWSQKLRGGVKPRRCGLGEGAGPAVEVSERAWGCRDEEDSEATPRESPLTSVFLPTPPPETVRTATPFPMVSLFLVFTAFVISNIGHIRPQRTILAFVSGIFFILSGKPKERTDRLQDHFRYQEPGAPLPIKPLLPCWVILKELQNVSKPHFAALWNGAFLSKRFLGANWVPGSVLIQPPCEANAINNPILQLWKHSAE